MAQQSSSDQPVFPVTFNWAKASFSPFAHITGFFLYSAIILFICFGFIPNFLPVPDWVYRLCAVAFIFLIDRLFTRLFMGYTLQGKVEIGEKDLRLVSVRGRTEHILNYSEIHQIHVMEGIPMSLFTAFSEHRTVVVQVVFKDLRTMQFESTKKANEPNNEWTFGKVVDSIDRRLGI